MSVRLPARLFALWMLTGLTIGGVALLPGQVSNGELSLVFAVVWFGLVLYGLYFGLAIWPQRIAVHDDGTIEFRALLRAHRWQARDVRSIRLVGPADQPRSMIFSFDLNEVSVVPVPIDYSDLVSRCERANPDISVVRSWHP